MASSILPPTSISIVQTPCCHHSGKNAIDWENSAWSQCGRHGQSLEEDNSVLSGTFCWAIRSLIETPVHRAKAGSWIQAGDLVDGFWDMFHSFKDKHLRGRQSSLRAAWGRADESSWALFQVSELLQFALTWWFWLCLESDVHAVDVLEFGREKRPIFGESEPDVGSARFPEASYRQMSCYRSYIIQLSLELKEDGGPKGIWRRTRPSHSEPQCMELRWAENLGSELVILMFN